MFGLKYEFSSDRIKNIYDGKILLENKNSFHLKCPKDIEISSNDLLSLNLKLKIDISEYQNLFIIECFTPKNLLDKKCVVVPTIIDSLNLDELIIHIHNYDKSSIKLKKGELVCKCFILDNSKVLNVV